MDPEPAALATERATSAATTSIFEGMQPRLRQVPPNRSRSMIALRHPASSGPKAMLPVPAPTTMRSYRVACSMPRPTPARLRAIPAARPWARLLSGL